MQQFTVYILKCWQTTKRNKGKLALVEMDCLRRSCQISWLFISDNFRNDVIREWTNVKASINGLVEHHVLI